MFNICWTLISLARKWLRKYFMSKQIKTHTRKLIFKDNVDLIGFVDSITERSVADIPKTSSLWYSILEKWKQNHWREVSRSRKISMNGQHSKVGVWSVGNLLWREYLDRQSHLNRSQLCNRYKECINNVSNQRWM